MLFAYLRDGDRVGAPVHRVLSNSVLLLDTPVKRLELPEGAEIMAYRKEREAAGVEFRYRLVSFLDWFKAQDQGTVRKWRGENESIYPVPPAGTFWSEHATTSEPWMLSLLSDETGEPVEGHEELVTKVREDLLAKTNERISKKEDSEKAAEEAPTGESKPEEQPVADAPAADATETPAEGTEAAPSEAGAATDEASA